MTCCAVTIRLAPLLPTNVAVAQFPDVRKATEASIEIMNRGAGIRMYHRLLKGFILTRCIMVV